MSIAELHHPRRSGGRSRTGVVCGQPQLIFSFTFFSSQGSYLVNRTQFAARFLTLSGLDSIFLTFVSSALKRRPSRRTKTKTKKKQTAKTKQTDKNKADFIKIAFFSSNFSFFLSIPKTREFLISLVWYEIRRLMFLHGAFRSLSTEHAAPFHCFVYRFLIHSRKEARGPRRTRTRNNFNDTAELG